MNLAAPGRLVILSGPSCVGKSPLDKALARLYPKLHARLRKLVLHTSRAPRPGWKAGPRPPRRSGNRIDFPSFFEEFRPDPSLSTK
jgi:hypothetical protein